MQQPERYNNSIHQPLHVTVATQPSNEQINKLNYYDIEVNIFLVKFSKKNLNDNFNVGGTNINEFRNLSSTQL